MMDVAVARIKARPLPADYRDYRPETLRCGCGWSTDATLAAVVHGWADHGIRSRIRTA